MVLYKASTQHLYSEIDSEAVILDIDSGTYYGLNEISNRIWQLLQIPSSEHQLVTTLLEEYEVTKEKATEDLQHFLQNMSNAGLIEVVNEKAPIG